MYSSILLTGAYALFASHVAAQAGPNTLAQYNPKLRTQSLNQNTTSVAAAVPLYSLLSVPTGAGTLFPKGFPAGKHPVLVATAYDNDIRQYKLEIDSLMSGQVYVPYVDRLADGKTPFAQPVANYVGGTNGQLNQAVIPGSAEGITIYVAKVMPDTAAYQPLGNGQFSSQVKQVIVPNPVSGPGVVPAAFDLLFSNAPKSKQPYPAKTYQSLLNQPLILSNGMCQRNQLFFNASFAEPIMQTGSVVLYSGSIPSELAGNYKGVAGYSVNAENVGQNPQTCQDAADDDAADQS